MNHTLMFLAVLVIAKVSAENADLKKAVTGYIMECIKEYPVSTPDLIQLKTKQGVPDSTRCFLLCVYKKLNIMDDQGTFNTDQVNQMTEQYFSDNPEKMQKAQEFVKACSGVNDQEVDACFKAGILYQCVIDKAPLYGLSQ